MRKTFRFKFNHSGSDCEDNFHGNFLTRNEAIIAAGYYSRHAIELKVFSTAKFTTLSHPEELWTSQEWLFQAKALCLAELNTLAPTNKPTYWKEPTSEQRKQLDTAVQTTISNWIVGNELRPKSIMTDLETHPMEDLKNLAELTGPQLTPPNKNQFHDRNPIKVGNTVQIELAQKKVKGLILELTDFGMILDCNELRPGADFPQTIFYCYGNIISVRAV